ncbi:hypothetical protein [Sorangium sp. So ce124]|uniref:hypothetical protein n=1 Tax=Sorangium sp. So ce124 TaxID=3133280 RepID=UPI003F5F6852
MAVLARGNLQPACLDAVASMSLLDRGSRRLSGALCPRVARNRAPIQRGCFLSNTQSGPMLSALAETLRGHVPGRGGIFLEPHAGERQRAGVGGDALQKALPERGIAGPVGAGERVTTG